MRDEYGMAPREAKATELITAIVDRGLRFALGRHAIRVWQVTHLETDSGGDCYSEGLWWEQRDAVAAIKAQYGEPYIVNWHEEQDSDGCLILVGDFELVIGRMAAHKARWAIEAVEVMGSPSA